MVLNNEEHRSVLVAAIEAVNWPGASLELVLDTKRAVQEATVVPEDQSCGRVVTPWNE